MPRPKQFKTQEEYLEWYRNYRALNREKLRSYYREYNRIWRKKNGYINEKRWKKKNRFKINIEAMVYRAIKKGEIKRKPCLLCGKEKTVAHHPDYKKPLEVIFLCHLHHRAYHYKNKIKEIYDNTKS